MRIALVGSTDLPELLPLVRAYCDFYQVTPSDRELLEAVAGAPGRSGAGGAAVAGPRRRRPSRRLRHPVLDLADAGRRPGRGDERPVRGAGGTRHGVAEGLIAACLERCRGHGATRLLWQTASDNHRAHAVYGRVGATRDDRWLDYDLPVQPL